MLLMFHTLNSPVCRYPLALEVSQNSSSDACSAEEQALLFRPSPRQGDKGSMDTERRPPTEAFREAQGMEDQQG
jgi:hypothetical protein